MSASTADAVSTSRTAALRLLAVLMLLGVVLQAVFIGGSGGLGATFSWGVTAHSWGANVTFAAAAAQLALVFLTPAFRADRRLVAGVVALVVTLTAIIGLGYVARESRWALAVHVPLAVVVAIGASDHLRSANRVASPADPG